MPKRIESFFDWVNSLDNITFKNNILDKCVIEKLYKKRNNYVHDGKHNDITLEDLILSDELILNILSNIVHHIKLFKTKDHLVSYCDKFQAEKLLSLKTKTRPNTIFYLTKIYSKKKIELLKDYYV